MYQCGVLYWLNKLLSRPPRYYNLSIFCILRIGCNASVFTSSLHCYKLPLIAVKWCYVKMSCNTWCVTVSRVLSSPTATTSTAFNLPPQLSPRLPTSTYAQENHSHKKTYSVFIHISSQFDVLTTQRLYNDPVPDSYLLHAFVIENAYQAAASIGSLKVGRYISEFQHSLQGIHSHCSYNIPCRLC